MSLITKTVKEGEIDIKRVMAGAFEEIRNFTAIIVLPDNRNGSGVYVNVAGVYGILTAWHVAHEVFKGDKFSLCVAEYEHSFTVEVAKCDHIAIGENRNESEAGPDLSLIVIRDTHALSVIRSRKSFAVLESQDQSRFDIDLSGMRWVIAGCPHYFKTSVDAAANKIMLCNMLSSGVYVGREARGDYDYIKIKYPSDQPEKFPTRYEGVSGGALWAVGMTCNPPKYDLASVTHQKPVLAGIAYYQSAPADGWITLTCHGYESIYRNIAKAIKATPPA